MSHGAGAAAAWVLLCEEGAEEGWLPKLPLRGNCLQGLLCKAVPVTAAVSCIGRGTVLLPGLLLPLPLPLPHVLLLSPSAALPAVVGARPTAVLAAAATAVGTIATPAVAAARLAAA